MEWHAKRGIGIGELPTIKDRIIYEMVFVSAPPISTILSLKSQRRLNKVSNRLYGVCKGLQKSAPFVRSPSRWSRTDGNFYLSVAAAAEAAAAAKNVTQLGTRFSHVST